MEIFWPDFRPLNVIFRSLQQYCHICSKQGHKLDIVYNKKCKDSDFYRGTSRCQGRPNKVQYRSKRGSITLNNREEVIYRKTSEGSNGLMRLANRLGDVFDIKGVSFDRRIQW